MQYTVNSENLTIRDLIAIQDAGNDIKKMIPIYERCLNLPEGMSVLDLPAKHLKLIAQAIVKEMMADDVGN
jgi:hypothetical protein